MTPAKSARAPGHCFMTLSLSVLLEKHVEKPRDQGLHRGPRFLEGQDLARAFVQRGVQARHASRHQFADHEADVSPQPVDVVVGQADVQRGPPELRRAGNDVGEVRTRGLRI
jgi:hypothetical protein